MTDASKAKTVLMVVNTYAPDDPRVIFSATSLVRMNYRVRLIGAARQRERAVLAQQTIEGVSVLLTPVVNQLKAIPGALWAIIRGKLPTTLQADQQRTSSISLLIFSLWVLRIGLSEAVDVVHCHDISPLPVCWLVARMRRARLIYDIHENVPTMYAGRKGRILTSLERHFVPRVDVVIAAGERLARVMPERGARQVVHVGNWKRLDDYQPDPEVLHALRQKLSLADPTALIISHIGTLDSNRELEPLLEAAAQTPDVTLLIGGRGSEQNKVIEASKAYPNIRWLGWVDLQDIPAYTHLSTAVYYCRSPQHYGGSYELAPAPNKLYEAFAAGVPVIARRGVGEIGEILEKFPAGILLDDVTPQTIKAAFHQLRDLEVLKRLREAALAARDQFNWSVAEARLAAVYHNLTCHDS